MFPSNAVGSIVGIGGMAGSVGGILLSVSAGKILQITHNYTSLFLIAGSVYLLAIIVLRTLAPNLRRVDLQS
jgi:ACS family hexuronate transporter-like MFS transporter